MEKVGYMTQSDRYNGSLELFWGDNFGSLKLALKYHNSILSLSIGAKKKIVVNKIVQFVTSIVLKSCLISKLHT
jgi:hypothetical protein